LKKGGNLKWKTDSKLPQFETLEIWQRGEERASTQWGSGAKLTISERRNDSQRSGEAVKPRIKQRGEERAST
jgi:hypothetical protein